MVSQRPGGSIPGPLLLARVFKRPPEHLLRAGAPAAAGDTWSYGSNLPCIRHVGMLCLVRLPPSRGARPPSVSAIGVQFRLVDCAGTGRSIDSASTHLILSALPTIEPAEDGGAWLPNTCTPARPACPGPEALSRTIVASETRLIVSIGPGATPHRRPDQPETMHCSTDKR